AMSLVGFLIKRDLSFVGRFAMMSLIGIIIASIVNIFVASSALYWGVTYLGVLLFAGLTAYDTQKIKMMLMQYGGEVNNDTMKMALMGSLTLYLDFVNLFLFILRIVGGNRE
uniref:Bax inhibitor-1/YccA family protein n=1 Tax=Alloprevotella sp. TaxID=1872471 RepID=UPI004025C7F1